MFCTMHIGLQQSILSLPIPKCFSCLLLVSFGLYSEVLSRKMSRTGSLFFCLQALPRLMLALKGFLLRCLKVGVSLFAAWSHRHFQFFLCFSEASRYIRLDTRNIRAHTHTHTHTQARTTNTHICTHTHTHTHLPSFLLPDLSLSFSLCV